MALNFSIQSDPLIVRKENGQEELYNHPPTINHQPNAGHQPGWQPMNHASHHGGNLQFQDFPHHPNQNNFSYGYNQGEQESQMMILGDALQAPPNSWLIFSIFSCLCCCWPIGIAAIVFSVRSNDQKALRNYQKSRDYARTALILNITSVVVGTIVLVVAIVVWTTQILKATNVDINDYTGNGSG